MPKLDKTGPRGEGPRTGRGMGDCPSDGTSQGLGVGLGRGMGRSQGRGFGRFCLGCPFCGNQQITKEEQKKILEEEKKLIEEELKDL